MPLCVEVAVEAGFDTMIVTREVFAVLNLTSPTTKSSAVEGVAPRLMRPTRSPGMMSQVVDARVISPCAPDVSAASAQVKVVELPPFMGMSGFALKNRFVWATMLLLLLPR